MLIFLASDELHLQRDASSTLIYTDVNSTVYSTRKSAIKRYITHDFYEVELKRQVNFF